MDRSRRRTLHAADRDPADPSESPEPVAPLEPGEPRPRGRSVLLGLGIGLGVGVAGVALAFSIVAIPLFLLASTEPGSGLNRDLVRRGLFQVAVPFGVLVGVAAGTVVGVWYARGGRLPTDRTPIHDR